MTAKTFRKRLLESSSALQALALVGVGVAGSAIAIAPAYAQDYTNVNASGRVVDSTGNPIAGATVTITSNAQGWTRDVVTDSSGSYIIPSLPQGSYTFTISAPGQETFTDPNVQLTQSTAANEFQLGTSSTTTDASGNAIVVSGRRVRVSDFERATTGSVIPIGEMATRVPVARDLTSVVLLAPGTSQGDAGFGNLPSIAGASVSENAYFLNGLNLTDFRLGLGSNTVPFEFYNTVEVKNGGIPAEFGRFTGGFVNATTKSGGNEFHGGVLFNFEPDELREDSPNSVGAGNQAAVLTSGFNQQDKAQRLESIAWLSGPIIKDRLFFYGLYQSNNRTTGDTLLTSGTAIYCANGATATSVAACGATGAAAGTLLPYSTGLRREERSTTSPFFGGKLDAIIADGHRLEGTYFNTRQITRIDTFNLTDVNGGQFNTLFDTGAPVKGGFNGRIVRTVGGENYVGRYTGQFTDWLTLSAAYGKSQTDDIAGSDNDDYPAIGGEGYTGNSATSVETSNDTREFYRADADVFVNLFGRHHFRGGYDKEKLTTDSALRYTGNVAYTYFRTGAVGDDYAPPNTFYVAGRTFINGGVFESNNEAFYLQDSWSLLDNRITLNLGVRMDRFDNKNAEGETYYQSGDLWAPRVGFSADVLGDGTTKLFGTYGKYYLPVVSNTNIRLAGAELDYTRYFTVAGVNADNTPIFGAPLTGFDGSRPCPDTGVQNCEIISDGEALATEATVAQGLKPQSVDEWQVGIERNLGNRMRVSLTGTYRKLNESLEDVAVDAAVIAYCEANGIPRTAGTTGGCEDIWTGFHQYVLVNPGSASRITLSDPLPGGATAPTIDFTAEQLGYPKARRTYKAVTATFDREFDGVWSLSGSYTWSKNEGNIEGGIRSDNGQDDSGITTSFDQPGLVDGTYGYLPGDARHKFKVYGSYQVTDWLLLGANALLQSPRRFGCIGRVPNIRDEFAGAYGAAGFYCNVDSSGKVITDPTFPVVNSATDTTLKITPRGSQFQSDWLSFLNLTAAVTVPLEQFKPTFRVDVFNVFNQKAAIDFEERGTIANGRPRQDYGQPNVYQTPRYFRFQLGVEF